MLIVLIPQQESVLWAFANNSKKIYQYIIINMEADYKPIVSSGAKAVKQYAVLEDANLSHRPYMEDRYYCKDSFMGHPKQALFAIFDGHGGKDASDYCSTHLESIFTSILKHTSSIEAAMLDLFKNLDEKLNEDVHALNFGTTACVAFIAIEQGERVLYLANAGDSRAVIGSNEKAERLTIDHKCTVEKECERIKKSGGVIIYNRLGGNLAVSRSLGDFSLREMGLISVPYLNRRVLRSNDKWLVLASDGLFDVLSDSEVVGEIWKDEGCGVAAKKLVSKAIAKGSLDNISCIVVKL
jgi:protein phosphatase PTC1